MSAIVRGIFPVLQTAVNDDDGLDVVSLRKQVDFCIQAGAHGLGDAGFVPQLEHLAANPLFRGVRFWDQSREDIHQGPFLDDIAHLVAFLASDKASFMTGEHVCVDGGLMAKGTWADTPYE